MAQRLGEAMAQTISVCDRESDIFEYLRYKSQQKQRFVIRARSDRCLLESNRSLFESLSGEQAWRYETTVEVAQRGGRPGRQAAVQVYATRVSLQPPLKQGRRDGESLCVSAVRVLERSDDAKALNWVLLSSEPVESVEQVKRIVRDYELRWRIEEYHKAWKSGVGVERLRLQSAANLERMIVITAFVATRLLQLREALSETSEKEEAQARGEPNRGCERLLKPEEWKVLWLTNQKPPLPSSPPPVKWACLAIAKLGGFTDTKRTGRPGWNTLWRGWQLLQERVEGFILAQENMTRKNNMT